MSRKLQIKQWLEGKLRLTHGCSTLFPNEECRGWSTKQLLSKTPKARDSLPLEALEKVITAFEDTVRIRNSLLKCYPFEDPQVQRSHEYFVQVLEKMIRLLKSPPAVVSVEVTPSEPDDEVDVEPPPRQDRPAEEEVSLDNMDISYFLDIIESSLDEIYKIWKERAVDKREIATTSVGMDSARRRFHVSELT